MSNSLIADLASSEIHSRTDADILLESRLDDCSASVSDFFSSCTGQRRIDLLEEVRHIKNSLGSLLTEASSPNHLWPSLKLEARLFPLAKANCQTCFTQIARHYSFLYKPVL